MSITRPNLVQQENRLRTVPDAALREMLLRMGQTGQVGSPEYLLAAGEMQARKNARQQAQMGQPQQPPVIADLLSGVDMQGMMPQRPPQPQGQPMPMGPEEAGVAALPAQNLEGLDQPQYADGGIVAFQGGGPTVGGEFGDIRPLIQRGIAGSQSFDADVMRRRALSRQVVQKFAGDPTKRDIINQVDRLSVPQLESLLAADTPVSTPSLATTPTTPGDLRRLEAAAGDPYVTQPAPVVKPPLPDDKGIAALAAPKPSSYADLMSQASQFAGQIGPEAETAPTIQEAVAQQKQAMQEAGFDFGLIKDQIAQVRAEKEQSKSDRKEAVNLRLLEAGLGIMAGESPHAFVNIGKGAAPALKGLSDDIKEIKKIDRERDKAMRDLAVADNQIAAGMGLGALKTRESAQERIARANDNRAAREISIFGTLTSAETQRYVAQQGLAAAKEGRTEQREDRLAIEAQRQARELIKSSPQGMTMTPEQLEREVRILSQNIYNQMKALSTGRTPAGQARGRVVNGVYVPAGQ